MRTFLKLLIVACTIAPLAVVFVPRERAGAAAPPIAVKAHHHHRKAPSCHHEDLAQVVNLDNTKHAMTIFHVREATTAGAARILHIDRVHEDQHRKDSLRGVPTRHGFDRDEYPPAMSEEGGKGASIAYVRPADNRGAGSKMGHDLAPYCEGQAFILEP